MYGQQTLAVPTVLLKKIINANKEWEEASEQLEDFVLSSDKKFIYKMNKSKQEHKNNQVLPISKLQQLLA